MTLLQICNGEILGNKRKNFDCTHYKTYYGARGLLYFFASMIR